MNATIEWLLDSPEPWTRYRTLVDLLDQPESGPQAVAARREMILHPWVQALIAETAAWGERPLKRHNDASYPIYKFSTLADFGLKAGDPGLDAAIEKVLARQSPEGAFQSVVNIPKAFGGDGNDHWTWIICDAPTLLYSLLAFGLGGDPRLQRAVDHLAGLVDDNGWRCVCAPDLGKFRGPGKKSDPCPIANVYALKALSQVPELLDSPAARAGAETLLAHWASSGVGGGDRPYLFGAGSDYRKLKYPFVWYDILHVADVLNRFPFVHADPRFQAMLNAIAAQADAEGRYTATSMYQSWKSAPSPIGAVPMGEGRGGGWSFADKKTPSPWLTFLALRIQKRAG